MRPENLFDNGAKIKVVGVGGAGGNAVARMIDAGLSGVSFLIVNTDSQALKGVRNAETLQIGETLTRGLGAGGDPGVGEGAAKENETAIMGELAGCDMVFITAGMGGGTGTGAAPVIADIARRMGILTVGVVTKPFLFEGPKRGRLANAGAERLRNNVDTMITIPNNRLVEVVDKATTLTNAFRAADDVLRQGVQGISEIITLPGMINVDFADVRSIMSNAGVALMGLGTGTGINRAREAAEAAATSPLLETSIDGATKLLVNITAGPDFSIGEAHEAMEFIIQHADLEEADIIMGHVLKDLPENAVQITLLAAGMDAFRPSAPIKESEIFYSMEAPSRMPQSPQPEPKSLPKEVVAPPVQPKSEPEQKQATFIKSNLELDEIDLDLPAFLRKQRGQ